jgi:hypothetical protein
MSQAGFGHKGRRATRTEAGRPGLVSNGHQTWSRASTLSQEPMGSLVHHIGSHGVLEKPGQSGPIQHKPRTEGREFRFAPNFVPTFQTTIDEVRRLKIGGKGP